MTTVITIGIVWGHTPGALITVQRLGGKERTLLLCYVGTYNPWLHSMIESANSQIRLTTNFHSYEKNEKNAH